MLNFPVKIDAVLQDYVAPHPRFSVAVLAKVQCRVVRGVANGVDRPSPPDRWLK
jgi:hypothetical protein